MAPTFQAGRSREAAATAVRCAGRWNSGSAARCCRNSPVAQQVLRIAAYRRRHGDLSMGQAVFVHCTVPAQRPCAVGRPSTYAPVRARGVVYRRDEGASGAGRNPFELLVPQLKVEAQRSAWVCRFRMLLSESAPHSAVMCAGRSPDQQRAARWFVFRDCVFGETPCEISRPACSMSVMRHASARQALNSFAGRRRRTAPAAPASSGGRRRGH